MAKNTYRILLAIFFSAIYSTSSANIYCTGLNNVGSHALWTASSINIMPTPITWIGAANSMTIGAALSTATTGTEKNVFYCQNPTLFSKAQTANPQVWVSPKDTPLSGITYTINGTSYPIFPTGIVGVGYILQVGSPDANLGKTLPLGSSAQQILNAPNDGWASYGFNYLLQFVSTGTLTTGTNFTVSKTIADIQMRDGATNVTTTVPLILNSTSLTITAASCSVNAKNLNVNLPSATVNNFANVGSTSIFTPFSINLTCPNSVNTYMIFTDNNNIVNTSNQILINSNSIAKGIAVQIKKGDGSLVSLGPDSPNINTTNQFLVKSNMIGTQSIPFTAGIIRTGPITPGAFTAEVTFTFSYQ
ncbi:fimbrial protein [Aquitalea sp.]|uniref:fimbrial protein n=1 Tax=Aquitalea sp. TaxID=1872623 RepID=UPI002588C03B|nr:fimbrial protein [Aquitalea sp.]